MKTRISSTLGLTFIPDSLAGQMQALKTGSLPPQKKKVKKQIQEESSDEESDTDGDVEDTGDTDTDTETDDD